MPRAKKTDNVEKMDNEKTLMEIDNINPKKTKSKKIKDAIDDSKLAKDKPTDKPQSFFFFPYCLFLAKSIASLIGLSLLLALSISAFVAFLSFAKAVTFSYFFLR